MKWIPHRNNGDQTPIEVQKFKHWIGTQEHWFCVHKSLEMLGRYDVSDWASGYRVAPVGHLNMSAARNDAKAAARLTLNDLIERLGESKVQEVLRNAPKREKVLPNAVADATI
jgi:hypothetical protein